MNDSKEEFGKRLSGIRKSKNLKQQDLKEMIDAPTVQMISNWENGHAFPSPHYLIILAEKLDTSLDYLLLGKENHQSERRIATYKDACKCIVDLTSHELFAFDLLLYEGENAVTTLISKDRTISNFRIEYEALLSAKKSLRPELFDQAVADLLEKYDLPLKQKENKQTKK